LNKLRHLVAQASIENAIDAFFVLGAGAIVRGVGLMSEAWGWVALGVFALVAAALMTVRGR
jgi:hypothetical protein